MNRGHGDFAVRGRATRWAFGARRIIKALNRLELMPVVIATVLIGWQLISPERSAGVELALEGLVCLQPFKASKQAMACQFRWQLDT